MRWEGGKVVGWVQVEVEGWGGREVGDASDAVEVPASGLHIPACFSCFFQVLSSCLVWAASCLLASSLSKGEQQPKSRELPSKTGREGWRTSTHLGSL